MTEPKEITLRFELEKETKGAVRYAEAGTEAVGTLYVRKSALPSPYPKALAVTIAFG